MLFPPLGRNAVITQFQQGDDLIVRNGIVQDNGNPVVFVHVVCREKPFCGEQGTDHNGAAAIRISKDGKFIYVSNRGHDSIAVFKVLNDGKLELAQRISVFGSFPRDFNWDKSEKYLVVANQNTNNATLYRRNSETGNLTPLQKDIPVPEATRVLFEED